ncbi:hypothetical protein PILCRDRAFT_8835 [Piloderma croceum F 1598]|uniref:Uncharacterized protein n=1 Tax=Piloderma croceum (strain F 1598) TaxID=765440 RepID=A0A0C3FN59_PILCF|nr:hypothetical protein PILCRDRAFT_8835 [Piloderma croceum F 1598]
MSSIQPCLSKFLYLLFTTAMSASITINLPLPNSIPTPLVKVDYTAATVLQDIKDKVIKNSVLFVNVVNVVNVGPEVGTGLKD